MDYEKEELFSLLGELKNEIVIVEGKRDKEILENFDFNKVFVLNEKKGFYSMAEELKDKKVLILTDFDPEGEKIAKKLERNLESVGCKLDKINRKKLRALFIRNKINTIHGLKRINAGSCL